MEPTNYGIQGCIKAMLEFGVWVLGPDIGGLGVKQAA